MPNGIARRATAVPMPPMPSIPNVFPSGSCVKAMRPRHWPARRAVAGMWILRSAPIKRKRVVSAVDASTAPGVFETEMPRAAQAEASIES